MLTFDIYLFNNFILKWNLSISLSTTKSKKNGKRKFYFKCQDHNTPLKQMFWFDECTVWSILKHNNEKKIIFSQMPEFSYKTVQHLVKLPIPCTSVVGVQEIERFSRHAIIITDVLWKVSSQDLIILHKIFHEFSLCRTENWKIC